MNWLVPGLTHTQGRGIHEGVRTRGGNHRGHLRVCPPHKDWFGENSPKGHVATSETARTEPENSRTLLQVLKGHVYVRSFLGNLK